MRRLLLLGGVLAIVANAGATAEVGSEQIPSTPAAELLDGVEDIEDPMAFFPVETGRKWNYEIRREGAAVLPNRTHEILWEGREKQWFEEGSDAVDTDAPAFRQLIDSREVLQGSGLVNDHVRTYHLTLEPDRVLIHAAQIVGEREFTEELQRWEPALPLFQAPDAAEPPEPVRAGMYGMTLSVVATSVEIETVETLAGTFEDCLKATVTGTMAGQLDDFPELGEMDVTVDEIQWLARGVGLVKQHRVLRGEVTREPHGRFEVNLETFKELRAYSKPRD